LKIQNKRLAQRARTDAAAPRASLIAFGSDFRRPHKDQQQQQHPIQSTEPCVCHWHTLNMMMMLTRKKRKRRKTEDNRIMVLMWLMLMIAATTTSGGSSVAHSFVVGSSLDAARAAAAAKQSRRNHRHHHSGSSKSSSRRKQEQQPENTGHTHIEFALSSSSSSSSSFSQEASSNAAAVVNGQQKGGAAAASTTAVDTILHKILDDESAAHQRKRRLAVRMAFLTGMTDVALTCQFQSFCTMLTGALLWVTKSVVQVQLETMRYFGCIILCYMSGIALARTLRHVVIVDEPSASAAAAVSKHNNNKRLLRMVGMLVMVLFTAADVSFYTLHTSRIVPMTLLAVAYGLINSMGTDFAGTLTFVVTGHLTKLTHMLTDSVVERLRNKPNIHSAANAEAAKMSLQVLGGFSAGALVAFYLHLRHDLLLRRGIFTLLGAGYGALFYTFDGQRIRHWWHRRESASDMEVKRPSVQIFSLSQAKRKVHEAMARLAALQEDKSSCSSSQSKQQQQQQQHHDVVLRTVAPQTSYNVTNMVLTAINDAVSNDTNVVLVMPAAAAVAVAAAPGNVTATSSNRDSLLLEEEENAPEMGKNQQEDVVVFVLQDEMNATTASLPVDDIVES
jgi:Protein of unknown function (DUF1275)